MADHVTFENAYEPWRDGVWELTTHNGTRHLIHFDDAESLRIPTIRADGFVNLLAGDCTWQRLSLMTRVDLGRPARLFSTTGEWLTTSPVTAWGPLPDRVLLANGSCIVHSGVLAQHHELDRCRVPPRCWIHSPTEHGLRSWPIHYESERPGGSAATASTTPTPTPRGRRASPVDSTPGSYRAAPPATAAARSRRVDRATSVRGSPPRHASEEYVVAVAAGPAHATEDLSARSCRYK